MTALTTHSQLRRATQALQEQRFEDATELLSAVVARHPDNARARWLLAQSLARQQDIPAALDQLRLLIESSGFELETVNRVAAFLKQRGYPLQTALAAYERILDSHPRSANAAFNLAYFLGKDGRHEEAIEGYRRALELGVSAPQEVHLNIANLYMDHLQDPARARHHLQQALDIDREYADAWFNLGNLAEQAGDREEAAACFGKCLQLAPGNETALARLGDVHLFTDSDDPLLARMAAAATNSQNADLHFALGRAYDQLAEYELAWRHFCAANDLDRPRLPPYLPERAASLVDRIIRQCNDEWVGRFPGVSHAPVFICGMFRTGSTLLEQMLGAHPKFCAGGESEFFPRLVAREFPAWPDGLESLSSERLQAWRSEHADRARKLAGDSRRLIDKRPDNFLHAGLIRAVLPLARFVITERDWRDVALSIFSTRLGVGQNYATRLEDIRHYIGLQGKLVGHWEQCLGTDLMRVRYEDLVERPREVIGDLLQWLGVDFDERCMSFDRQGRPVRTASAWQVRQPLHAKSIGRWQHYRRHFEAAFAESLED